MSPNPKRPKTRNRYQNIRALALASVEKPDGGYTIRKIQRAFATTFNVSLLKAEKLDLGYMLQHLYEHQFENMTVAERTKVAKELLKSDEELNHEERQRLEAEDDDEFVWFTESVKIKVNEKKTKAKKQPKQPVAEPLPEEVNLKFNDDDQ